MIAGTLVYRLSQGGAVDLAFFRSEFPLAAEFPPQSWGFLLSFPPSILEEVAFRGVILALFLRFYNKPKAILISALAFGVYHLLGLLSPGNNRELVWVVGNIVWASILGLFYAYVTLKTGSLLPSMLVHYLGNISVYPLTAYIQHNAPIPVQALYGIIFTLGAIPVVLMYLWTRAFTSRWPLTPKT
jgi:membrane protease YdiL (CAAX protease family)